MNVWICQPLPPLNWVRFGLGGRRDDTLTPPPPYTQDQEGGREGEEVGRQPLSLPSPPAASPSSLASERWGEALSFLSSKPFPAIPPKGSLLRSCTKI